MTQTISSKDLRLKFPWVQEQLSQGVQFIVICRSKPVGILKGFEASEADMIRAQISDMEKGLEPLSREETDYYLGLPDRSYKAS